MLSLHLIAKKYQTTPNGGPFYKITGLKQSVVRVLKVKKRPCEYSRLMVSDDYVQSVILNGILFATDGSTTLVGE